jgi:hypothetical protein
MRPVPWNSLISAHKNDKDFKEKFAYNVKKILIASLQNVLLSRSQNIILVC